MTYQPVYGIVSDVNCERTTSSRRGKVRSIYFEGLTHFGKAISVNVFSEGHLDRMDEGEAKDKIIKWAEKGNQKRAMDWARKLRERKEYNNKQDKQEEVIVDIKLGTNEKMKFRINNVEITQDMLNVIREDKDLFKKIHLANEMVEDTEKQ